MALPDGERPVVACGGNLEQKGSRDMTWVRTLPLSQHLDQCLAHWKIRRREVKQHSEIIQQVRCRAGPGVSCLVPKLGFVFLVSFKQAVLWVEVTAGCSISALRSQGKETLLGMGALYLIRQSISHFSVDLWDPF